MEKRQGSSSTTRYPPALAGARENSMIPSKTVSPVNAKALIAHARLEKPFYDALQLAKQLYAKQKRAHSGVEYLSRPLTVASLLLDHKYATPVLVAGVLGEALVRTTLKPTTLREKFGPEVADMVELLTPPKEVEGEAWDAYVQRLAAATPEVQSIKMAELLEGICALPRKELSNEFAFLARCEQIAAAMPMANEELSRRVMVLIRAARG